MRVRIKQKVPESLKILVAPPDVPVVGVRCLNAVGRYPSFRGLDGFHHFHEYRNSVS